MGHAGKIFSCLHALFAEEKLRLRAKRAHVLQRLRVFDGRVERERADFPQQLHGSIPAASSVSVRFLARSPDTACRKSALNICIVSPPFGPFYMKAGAKEREPGEPGFFSAETGAHPCKNGLPLLK